MSLISLIIDTKFIVKDFDLLPCTILTKEQTSSVSSLCLCNTKPLKASIFFFPKAHRRCSLIASEKQ
jgi:hypothetical protein